VAYSAWRQSDSGRSGCNSFDYDENSVACTRNSSVGSSARRRLDRRAGVGAGRSLSPIAGIPLISSIRGVCSTIQVTCGGRLRMPSTRSGLVAAFSSRFTTTRDLSAAGGLLLSGCTILVRRQFAWVSSSQLEATMRCGRSCGGSCGGKPDELRLVARKKKQRGMSVWQRLVDWWGATRSKWPNGGGH